jgi:hypothetical protein
MNWVRSMLSESDGSVSIIRFCILMIFSFVIGAGITLVIKLHTPVTPMDINNFMSAAGIFITTTCAPLYAINKGADVLNNKTQATTKS